jgi:hypothetical protein
MRSSKCLSKRPKKITFFSHHFLGGAVKAGQRFEDLDLEQKRGPHTVKECAARTRSEGLGQTLIVTPASSWNLPRTKHRPDQRAHNAA